MKKYTLRYMITTDGHLFHHIDTFTGVNYEDIRRQVMKKYPGATKENEGKSNGGAWWILI